MVRRCEIEPTCRVAAYPVPHFHFPIPPWDRDPGYSWTLDGLRIGGHINLTPIEDSGQKHPSRLNSDVFWTWGATVQRRE